MSKKQLVLRWAIASLLIFTTYNLHAQIQEGPYRFSTQIKLPGNGSYDYLYLDHASHRLYVTHGSDLDVINVLTNRFVGAVQGMGKIHGIAILPSLHRGFVSDSRNRCVAVFDTRTLKLITRIPLNEPDADGLLYDSYSGKLFCFEGDAQGMSVIDPVTLKRIHQVDLGGSPEFAVSDSKGQVYNNLEDQSQLLVIEAQTQQILHRYPLSPCGGPTGLALDTTDHRLFTVCRKNTGMSVVDATDGQLITTLPIGRGVDAVRYDPETHLIICSNADGTATVIHQDNPNHYHVVQILKTTYHAKTMELDPATHRIYFSACSYDPELQHALPGTFRVLVYDLKP